MDIEFFFFFFFYCFDVSIDYEVLLYNKPVNEVKKDGKKEWKENISVCIRCTVCSKPQLTQKHTQYNINYSTLTPVYCYDASQFSDWVLINVYCI